MCSLFGRFRFSDSLVFSTSFEHQLLIAQLFFALFYFKFKQFSENLAYSSIGLLIGRVPTQKRSVLAAAISPATDRGSNLYHGKVVDEGHSAAGLEGEMGSIVLVELEPAVEDVTLTVVWK